jgi:hypothetical protein
MENILKRNFEDQTISSIINPFKEKGLLKNIDILLNCKFEKGEYLETATRMPLTIYNKEVLPKKVGYTEEECKKE